MSRPAVGPASVAQASPADRWVSRAAAATVTALAGLAGAISYSQMRQLAQSHGQDGWHAHAFPLSVDGLEIVASLVLLACRRAGRRTGWLPWAALVTGTVGSLAANVATAGPGTISRLIAGWPALALLIAVKLLSGMLDRPESPFGPDSVTDVHDEASKPAAHRQTASAPTTSAMLIDTAAHSPTAPRRPARRSEDLLPAARATRDELYRDGRPLTRDALAVHLRQCGHPVGNARLTQLLQTLRSEPANPSAPRPMDQAV